MFNDANVRVFGYFDLFYWLIHTSFFIVYLFSNLISFNDIFGYFIIGAINKVYYRSYWGIRFLHEMGVKHLDEYPDM